MEEHTRMRMRRGLAYGQNTAAASNLCTTWENEHNGRQTGWLGFSNPCGMQVTMSQREEPGAPKVSLYDLYGMGVGKPPHF